MDVVKCSFLSVVLFVQRLIRSFVFGSGTFTKRSTIIRPRRPFAKDHTLVSDYENDRSRLVFLHSPLPFSPFASLPSLKNTSMESFSLSLSFSHSNSHFLNVSSQ
jgi:hypothetical protein